MHDLTDGTSIVVEVDSGRQQWVTKAQRERLAARADVSPRLTDPSTWLTVGWTGRPIGEWHAH